MKKILVLSLAFLLLISNCFAASDWKRGTNDDVVKSTDNPTDTPTLVKTYAVDPLDKLLNHHIYGCALTWTSATVITISEGELTIPNSGNTVKVLRQNTATTTVNTAVSGVGGLDTGSLGASTWYHIYADGDAAGPTFTCIFSASASAPTGVTNYRYIGSFLTDGSKNIIKFYSQGKGNDAYVEWDVDRLITTAAGDNQSCATAMPPNSTMAEFAVNMQGTNAICGVEIHGSGFGSKAVRYYVGSSVSDTPILESQRRCMTSATQTIDVVFTQVSTANIYIEGYYYSR